MATQSGQEVGELTYENVKKFARTHEEPCVTAGEIADAFGISNEAANYRLKRLQDRGEMREKEVGASAKVWYLTG